MERVEQHNEQLIELPINEQRNGQLVKSIHYEEIMEIYNKRNRTKIYVIKKSLQSSCNNAVQNKLLNICRIVNRPWEASCFPPLTNGLKEQYRERRFRFIAIVYECGRVFCFYSGLKLGEFTKVIE